MGWRLVGCVTRHNQYRNNATRTAPSTASSFINKTAHPTPLSTPQNKWSASVVRPYSDQTIGTVANSFAVFKLCGIPAFVQWGPWVLETAERVPGLRQASRFIVKKTFFKHFCGGETADEVHKTMINYRKRGIGVILYYAVEAEISTQTPTLDQIITEAQRTAMGMKESATIAAQHPQNFIAVKISPFIPPNVLVRWTNTLRAVKSAFDRATAAASDGKVSKDRFFDALGAEFPVLQQQKDKDTLFEQINSDRNGFVDYIDVSNMFTIANKEARTTLLVDQKADIDTGLKLATEEDFKVFDAVVPILEDVVSHSKNLNVKVIIDAEWTYVQPAIDEIALYLTKKYNGVRGDVTGGINGGRPVIFNTYQMYLKDALGRVKIELERARRENYNIGVKIVRGAYIVSETDRANKMNYENPICASLEHTHASYNAGIDVCLSAIKEITPDPKPTDPLPIQFFVASHNFESVLHADKKIRELGLDPESDCVGFGQLMGMQDGTTYAVAANGLKGYKCVPYGPVDVTIPYLVRRAQENSAVLGGVAVDKNNLWEEIYSRLSIRYFLDVISFRLAKNLTTR
ncbi:hypothetical protein HK100_012070 [Physocladia obscura]|uniref:Proline dehydrogenase n=1 Tax=Physocladia obscura TaxID=109957 RepID=A0AAD5XGI7_9FUNG|nr:hypothetical protein HK100_012070 [Physocladia obscura]